MRPWEIKVSDQRKENTKKLFIIFCEDEAIETTYFDFFKKSDLHISTIGTTKQHHAQVDYATEHFRKNDLLKYDKDGIEFLDLNKGTQVWCVFDRDKELNDQRDTAFNDSIKTANSKGIKTAWSNDNFELWVLLHFIDIDPKDKTFLHRSEYYNNLTQIIKNHYTQEVKFQNPNFHYKLSMKSKRNFITYTYQLLKDKLSDAIIRAEKLESFFTSTQSFPAHLCSPMTKVHHLVKELIR